MPDTRLIHTLKSAAGLDDESYRLLLRDRYGATSSKDLSPRQADDLVACLKGLAPVAGNVKPRRAERPARFAKLDGRPGMASAKQLRMLEASWVQRSRGETLQDKQEAFLEFLHRRFQVERLEWIAQEDVGRILRAIQKVDPDAFPRRIPSPNKPSLKGA